MTDRWSHPPEATPAESPVVRPEPGDRAETRACARCGASYRWYPRTATTTETFSHLIGPSDGHMPVLHADDAKFYLAAASAAAVAAVRADTADQIEAMQMATTNRDVAGALAEAAALIRGRS